MQTTPTYENTKWDKQVLTKMVRNKIEKNSLYGWLTQTQYGRMSLSDPWYFARRQYSAISSTLDRSIPRAEKYIAISLIVASHSLFWNIIFDLKQAIESKRSSESGTQEVHHTYKHRSSATSLREVQKS